MPRTTSTKPKQKSQTTKPTPLRNISTTKRNFIIFVILFGLIGAYLLFKSMAAITVGEIQAESMTTVTGASQVVADSRAGNGQLLKITNGTASGTLTTSDIATTISIRARGDQCKGAPQAAIAIDGTQVLLASVSSTSLATYSSAIKLSPGVHTVTASLNNSLNFKKCTRALYLDVITAINDTPPPTTADTTSPVVNITAPSSGATVSGTATVTASASDNVGVGRVEFYVDGNLASTVTAVPYNYTWDTTAISNANHTVSAKAYDATGNVATSPSIGVTVSNATTSTLSGVAMPVGDVASGGHTWHQIVAEDFTKDASLGSWASDCDAGKILYTGASGAQWRAYPKCYLDTNQKRPYRSDQVLSVHDGSLDFWLHTVDGKPAGANPSPVLPTSGTQYQTYGRYEARFKITTSKLSEFYTAWLLWPQDESKWQCAESDFPENQLSVTTVNAFAHYGCGGSQDHYSTSTDKTQWHTYTQEWMPGKRNYYLDGVLIGSSTNQVYSGPQRWQLQTETNTNCDSTATCTEDGHLLVDWAVVYAY